MRSLSIDVLKIILAFFVVFLHMNLLRDEYPSLSYVLVNGLFRIGVPVFLIITGYYFYFVDTFDKLKKWSVRTFLLYAIWSAIYIPLWKEGTFFANIIFGYHHLWYLIGTLLAGILLFTIRKKSTSVLVAVILLLFSIGYCIQLLGNLHYFKGKLDVVFNLFPLYRNFLFVCFPFLGIGFLIKKLNIDVKQKPSLLLVLGSIALVIFESFLNYKVIHLSQKESIDMLISLLIACPLIFLYCKNLPFKTDSKILASLSTAIYLVHPLIMNWIFNLYLPSFEFVIFITVLLIVSLILVLVNRKVKYLL
ncbi:acyltransferase family protein [Chryseobacterium limigenitum]|uniref:Peptidoglycan/LPS O-acetylase OafA/YrhL, contains acyltransferase and SGNH-hydrolase domains n=1 Tax=Chryseobacterium limigenitum TaxID=1612149 RepID=A0A1K2IUX9_9FLAO|nr:acyltransferase family protein [Chryseobacterium limigenitum]SFZ96244.1 Peptidoglycan/LPS O-acetylase OafA/YrhL, contains acyltransferase and SGNH-hydrolase domains [Chryseobacterium limigenitum]